MSNPARFLLSAKIIAVFTMASRVLGLVRESVFAALFGVSPTLSAFRIAFMVPNLSRRLFGEGALSSSMIPILSEELHEHGEEAARRLVGRILTLLAVILTGLLLIGEAILLVWQAFKPDLALSLAVVLWPYMVLICCVAVMGGALNVRGHFSMPAFAPILLNCGLILFALGGSFLGFRDEKLMFIVAIGVIVSGFVQLGGVAGAMRVLGFFPIFDCRWRDSRLRAVFVMMGPMILGLSAVQINTLSDYVIAYVFVATDEGRIGPAVLGYAQYLYQLPLGVFGIALATAVFPLLSAKAAQNDKHGLAETFALGIRLSLFIALPASVGLIMVSRPLVSALFQRGDFDASGTQRVASVLVFYSLGLCAYFAQHVIVRTFYAMQNSRTPMRVSFVMVCVNLMLNLIFVQFMEERGLALSTAVCSVVQVCWLYVLLRTILPQTKQLIYRMSVLRSVLATAIMAGGLLLAQLSLPPNSFISSRDWLNLTLMVVGGVSLYGVASWLMRSEEFKMMVHMRNVHTKMR